MPVLYSKRVSPSPPDPSFKESYFVGGTTEEKIWSIVKTHWDEKTREIIASTTKKLQGDGVSPAIAPAIAEKFVSKLKKINGQRPVCLGNYGKVWEGIKRLLSGKELEEWIGVDCELSCRERCVGVLLGGIKEYMLFAWYYMQVHIEPIKMHIGGKVVQYTLPPYEDREKEYDALSCETIFKVSSPNFIGGLWCYHIPILPRRLRDEFKSLILGSCQQFTNSIDDKLHTYFMPYSLDYPCIKRLRIDAQKYIKKAYNVLVHKLLDRSGLPKLNARQTRLQILTNVSNPSEDIPVSLIDDMLEKMVSFLSETYIIL
jgi:hypothetical protein